MSDPYATHLPILKALSEFVPLRRVLEYGAGDYSTPFFLSLPDLKRLVSVEDDEEWATKRHVCHEVVTEAPEEDFDFVLVDDGRDSAARLLTIEAALAAPHPPTAIHDAEVYAAAIKQHAGYRFTFRFSTPHTALCWPERPDLDLTALAQRVAELT